MKKTLISLLSLLGIGITSKSNLKTLKKNQEEYFNLKGFLEFNLQLDTCSFPKNIIRPDLEIFSNSTSQLNQDLIVLMILDFPNNGYFVEFGACDGIRFSNTFLLESRYNWKGILAEPGRRWHSALKRNRIANLETKCVWKLSNETLLFNETQDLELSTLETFSSSDMHSNARVSGTRYEVKTISLNDLLSRYGAPTQIEYLSIDTEGSEFEILQGLDFDMYSFKFISCEHNYTDSLENVRTLLQSHGYVQILPEISLFDGWYIAESLAKAKGFI